MGGATSWARRCVDSLPTEQRRVSSSLSLSASLQRLVAVCFPHSPSSLPFRLFIPPTPPCSSFFSCTSIHPLSSLLPPSALPFRPPALLLFHPSPLTYSFHQLLLPLLFSLSSSPFFFKVVSARDRSCLHIQTFCAF